jgi:hypothetical protein
VSAASPVTLGVVALEQIAFDEAKRGIDEQRGALDGLRSRAGILLAAFSLATSFFGGLALSDDLSARATGAAIVAGIAFTLGAAACIAILRPSSGWAFSLRADGIIGQLDAARPDEATTYRELALRLQSNYDKNEGRLMRRPFGVFWLLSFACVALAVETIAWAVSLTL